MRDPRLCWDPSHRPSYDEGDYQCMAGEPVWV